MIRSNVTLEVGDTVITGHNEITGVFAGLLTDVLTSGNVSQYFPSGAPLPSGNAIVFLNNDFTVTVKPVSVSEFVDNINQDSVLFRLVDESTDVYTFNAVELWTTDPSGTLLYPIARFSFKTVTKHAYNFVRISWVIDVQNNGSLPVFPHPVNITQLQNVLQCPQPGVLSYLPSGVQLENTVNFIILILIAPLSAYNSVPFKNFLNAINTGNNKLKGVGAYMFVDSQGNYYLAYACNGEVVLEPPTLFVAVYAFYNFNGILVPMYYSPVTGIQSTGQFIVYKTDPQLVVS